MTEERLNEANQIKRQIQHVETSLNELGIVPYKTVPACPEVSLLPMQGVLSGFFDQDIYLLRVNDFLAKKKAELSAL